MSESPRAPVTFHVPKANWCCVALCAFLVYVFVRNGANQLSGGVGEVGGGVGFLLLGLLFVWMGAGASRFGITATDDYLLLRGYWRSRRVSWDKIASFRLPTSAASMADAEMLLRNGNCVKLFSAPIKNKYGPDVEKSRQLVATLTEFRRRATDPPQPTATTRTGS